MIGQETASQRKREIHEDILHLVVHLYGRQFVACKVYHESDDRQGLLQRPEQVWYPHIPVIREVKVTSRILA